MKLKLLTICLCITTVVSSFAQVDVAEPTKVIPVEKTNDAPEDNTTSDSPFNKPIELPEFKPEVGKEDPLDLPIGSSAKQLDYKRKEGFSMTQKSTLIDPGVLFEKRFKQKSKQIALEAKGPPGEFYKNKDLGNYITKSNKVTIAFADFGKVDGDYISVYHNDDLIKPRILLTGSLKGFTLDLKNGINKIDFKALNQGYEGYNTARVVVFDETGTIITSSDWYLATNFFANLIVVKEEESPIKRTDKDN